MVLINKKLYKCENIKIINFPPYFEKFTQFFSKYRLVNTNINLNMNMGYHFFFDTDTAKPRK